MKPMTTCGCQFCRVPEHAVAFVARQRGDSVTSKQWALPLTLPSVANLREHWRTKAKRTAAQRAAVALLCGNGLRALQSTNQAHRFVVTLTRVAPRALDAHDNLPLSLKAVSDECAAQLGFRNDRDPRIAFVRAQEKGPPQLLVSVDRIDP